MGSRALIEKALPALKKRFIGVVCSRLPFEGPEHDLALYRTRQLFDYTVVGGKYARATLSLDATRALQPHLQPESREMSAIAVASSTMEMIQSYYLIADDIMDKSEMRRGKPCWYKQPGIGFSAINDAFLLDSVVEDILRAELPGHVNIDRVCEAYRRAKQKTLVGQMLDTSSCGQVESFTWDRYELIVENKTSHYSVFHPIEQALLISDVLAFHGDVKRVAYQIGFLFQSQDDILDVYGDPETTGKIGTDIEDGKCTWLTVRALQKIQSAQNRDLFEKFKKNYGKPEKEAGDIVKQMFRDLRLLDEFRVFESKFAEQISTSIENLPEEVGLLRPILNDFVGKMRARKY
ncbi:unnamed protein product [Caenorhabditis auriculariae]|uniref:Farnesyl pyrophosphate synthase n=1 Tax=Caenorhabditis auriculariae TaxID=2777116 RepID=A0A8S1GZ62_9PELO|nr:unnamed protein product [Caenorhabditis auriculariae]